MDSLFALQNRAGVAAQDSKLQFTFEAIDSFPQDGRLKKLGIRTWTTDGDALC